MREGEDTCEKCCGIEKKIHIDQHIFVNTLKTEREMRREQAGKVKSAVIIAVAVGAVTTFFSVVWWGIVTFIGQVK